MNRIERKLVLGKEQIERVRTDFHFDEKDEEVLALMAERMGDAVRAEFAYVWDDEIGEKIQLGQRYALCCATLGGELDELLEILERENQLLEAYMLECLSMEMLSLLYEEGKQEIEKSGWFVTGYHFPDGEGGLIEQLAEKADFPVTYKEGYLIPQKSVIYTATLSKERPKEKDCGICQNCGRKDCMNRKKQVRSPKELLYGYRRILGG